MKMGRQNRLFTIDPIYSPLDALGLLGPPPALRVVAVINLVGHCWFNANVTTQLMSRLGLTDSFDVVRTYRAVVTIEERDVAGDEQRRRLSAFTWCTLRARVKTTLCVSPHRHAVLTHQPQWGAAPPLPQ